MTDLHIATIQKNAREEIRVGLSTYSGHRLLNVRVWFEAKDGTMRPGKAGLAFKVDKLPAFAAAVEKAATIAKGQGDDEL